MCLSWADFNDASTNSEVVCNDMVPSQSVRWADIKDDSKDNEAAQSDLNDASNGVKRDLDIADLSWNTDDGFGDAPGSHRKRMKTMCPDMPNVASIAAWQVSAVQVAMPCAVPVMMFQALPFQGDIAVQVPSPEIAKLVSHPEIILPRPETTETTEAPLKTLTKRQGEIKLIQRDFAEDIVARTPFTKTELFNVTKRPWEEAKSEYRTELKISQLKSHTQLNEDVIKRALKLVHVGTMKAQDHVQATLEHLRGKTGA